MRIFVAHYEGRESSITSRDKHRASCMPHMPPHACPQALALAAKTVAGAASMVMQGSSAGTVELTHPGVLKDRVASPAGTTIAG